MTVHCAHDRSCRADQKLFETAYLSESFRESTTNLYVYRSTLAKNIVFNGTTAIRVNVESGGVIYQLSAKEIVLSAGAVSRCNRMAQFPSGEEITEYPKTSSVPLNSSWSRALDQAHNSPGTTFPSSRTLQALAKTSGRVVDAAPPLTPNSRPI
jgi:hypothetical protein